MKRRMFALFLLLSLCLLCVLPAFAAEASLSGPSGRPLVVDNAGLLTAQEVQKLTSRLEEISARQAMDVAVVTTLSLDGKTERDYADDFYYYGGYADDGVLLLFFTGEERGVWISTKGYGQTAFTVDGMDYIFDEIIPDLSDGRYADAFERYASLADEYVTQARKGNVYDTGNLPKKPLSLIWIPIAIGVGALLALIPLGVMKGQLKSVRPQSTAASYVRQGSFELTANRDVFLYRNVTRRLRPKNNSSGGSGSGSHISSSGSSHGGSGRRF